MANRPCSNLRGTVQADILKEVQAQNESIFQPDFAIRLLGDVQEWFIANEVRKFYSLSISGYHIGEAGASPVQELAFTLANGFTYVENFQARGMAVNDFAPSLSFFFKVSHEAEWLAYGAVCRRIWAIALRDVYGAERAAAQRLKFHTQTSGRALQAEEWDTLNPVRLTYHALLGLLANANSLHVDSADEPMTTPGEKWVRQATMIPNYLREEAEGFVIQNLLSGSYAFRALVQGSPGPGSRGIRPASTSWAGSARPPSRATSGAASPGTAPATSGSGGGRPVNIPNRRGAGSSATTASSCPTASRTSTRRRRRWSVPARPTGSGSSPGCAIPGTPPGGCAGLPGAIEAGGPARRQCLRRAAGDGAARDPGADYQDAGGGGRTVPEDGLKGGRKRSSRRWLKERVKTIMSKRGTQPDKIDRLEPKERKGLIVVITGHGKGKTTSALGMAVRACGHGMQGVHHPVHEG